MFKMLREPPRKASGLLCASLGELSEGRGDAEASVLRDSRKMPGEGWAEKGS